MQRRRRSSRKRKRILNSGDRYRKRRRLVTEEKFLDGSITENPLPNGPQPVTIDAGAGPSLSTNIAIIPQGISQSSRIGRKVTVTAFHARLNFEFLDHFRTDLITARDINELVRIVLYQDKQANGQAATFENITTGTLSTDILNYRDLSNSSRFNIFYDKIFTWNTTVTSAGGGSLVATKTSERLKKEFTVEINEELSIPMSYSGTLGSISELESSSLGLFIGCKHQRMRLNTISRWRLRYLDR